MEKSVYAAVLLVLGVLPPTVGAAAYGISSPSAVDTPDRTVSVGGEPLEVTEVARVSQGDRVVLVTDAPSSATYDVELRDSDRRLLADREGSGDDTIQFSTGSRSPGTYFAALYDDGSYRAVLPVVVKGYTVDENVPDEAAAGSEIEVSASLTEEANAPSPDTVEVVVAEEGSEAIVARQPLSRDGSTTYSGTVSVDDTGDYNVYVFVRGDEEIDGEKILLGLSDPVSLEVTEAEMTEAEETPTATPVGTSDDGADGVEPAETATGTVTSMSTSTPTRDPTTTPDGSTAAGIAASSTAPGTETTEATPITGTDLPVGALPMVMALLVIGGVVRRWRR